MSRGPAGSVTAMSTPLSRDEAWTLLCRVDGVRLAAPAHAVGGDGDARLRRALRRGPRRVGHRRAAPRRRLRALPGPRDGPPARDHGRARAPRRPAALGPRDRVARRLPRGLARLARWRRRCSPSTSCAASSPRARTCGPEGIQGLTPKSVKKKLKQPSFAAAVSRDDVRDGAEGLGVEFDEHVAFVIAALEARADELGLSK